MLVLLSFWKLLCPEDFPTDSADVLAMVQKAHARIKKLALDEQISPMMSMYLSNILDKALGYCEEVDSKFPLVNSTLELGSTWIEVGLKLLDMYKDGDSDV